MQTITVKIQQSCVVTRRGWVCSYWAAPSPTKFSRRRRGRGGRRRRSTTNQGSIKFASFWRHRTRGCWCLGCEPRSVLWGKCCCTKECRTIPLKTKGRERCRESTAIPQNLWRRKQKKNHNEWQGYYKLKRSNDNDGEGLPRLPNTKMLPRATTAIPPPQPALTQYYYNHTHQELPPPHIIPDNNSVDLLDFKCCLWSCPFTIPKPMIPCFCFVETKHEKYMHPTCFRENILGEHGFALNIPIQYNNHHTHLRLVLVQNNIYCYF